MSSQESTGGLYFVVCQAPSSIRFDREDGFVVRNFSNGDVHVNTIFRTHYADEGHEALVPRQAYVEIQGFAPSLKDAINPFWNAAAELSSVIALSANTHFGNLEVEIGFDNTPDRSEREFFQSFLPRERGIPRPNRKINSEATLALIKAIGVHPKGARLHRATGYYNQALSYWRPGRELLAHTNLWMAIEAITPVARQRYMQDHGINNRIELAGIWGIEKRDVEGQVRRQLIFNNDEETYKLARDTRDFFVHATEPFHKLHKYAKEVLGKTARYFRTALLDLSGIDETHRQTLQDSPFDIPLGFWPVAKYLRGTLVGGGADKLGADDYAYPWFEGRSSFKSFTQNENGEYVLTPDEHAIAHLGEGVTFHGHSFEVWGPHPTKSDIGNEQMIQMRSRILNPA